MSGFFKAVGKVFKKVVKAVIKIAPYALAAAAVIFTGGAALNILPTFGAAIGGLVSSLGLSAAVTGALTGAITSAGFGAAIGFVTGGKKGMQKGALMGMLTGGVLGAVSPSTFGIVKGADGVVTTSARLAKDVATGLAPATPGTSGLTVANGGNIPVNSPIAAPTDMLTPANIQAGGQTFAPASAAQAVATASTPTGLAPVAQSPVLGVPGATNVAPSATSGPLGFVNNLLGGGSNGITGLVGSVLQSFGGGGDSAKDQRKEAEKLAKFAYGGVYSGQADPFGIQSRTWGVPQPRYYYDKATNTIVDRQQPAPEGV